jgi:hypothetical protein
MEWLPVHSISQAARDLALNTRYLQQGMLNGLISGVFVGLVLN